MVDHAYDTESPTYLQCYQEDSLLFTWLLTILSASVLPHAVKRIRMHPTNRDILELIGDPISHRDQLDTIIEGLSLNYQVLVSIIQYHDEPCETIVA